MNKTIVLFLILFLSILTGCIGTKVGVFIYEKESADIVAYKTACIDVANSKLRKLIEEKLQASTSRHSKKIEVLKNNCDVYLRVVTKYSQMPVNPNNEFTIKTDNLKTEVQNGVVVDQQNVFLFALEAKQFERFKNISQSSDKIDELRDASSWWGRSSIRMVAHDQEDDLCGVVAKLVNGFMGCSGTGCDTRN